MIRTQFRLSCYLSKLFPVRCCFFPCILCIQWLNLMYTGYRFLMGGAK